MEGDALRRLCIDSKLRTLCFKGAEAHPDRDWRQCPLRAQGQLGDAAGEGQSRAGAAAPKGPGVRREQGMALFERANSTRESESVFDSVSLLGSPLHAGVVRCPVTWLVARVPAKFHL